VAKDIREIRGKNSTAACCKFVLDLVNGTVYILVYDECDANSLKARSWNVDGALVSLYQVMNVSVRFEAEDFYQSVSVHQIFPTTDRPIENGIPKTQ
jgi:hypothetical protein